jgi:hypothetical protein
MIEEFRCSQGICGEKPDFGCLQGTIGASKTLILNGIGLVIPCAGHQRNCSGIAGERAAEFPRLLRARSAGQRHWHERGSAETVALFIRRELAEEPGCRYFNLVK